MHVCVFMCVCVCMCVSVCVCVCVCVCERLCARKNFVPVRGWPIMKTGSLGREVALILCSQRNHSGSARSVFTIERTVKKMALGM